MHVFMRLPIRRASKLLYLVKSHRYGDTMHPFTKPPVPLRQALLDNAAFSLATGLPLSVLPGTVGGWLGVEINGWLRLLGLALLGHAVALVMAARLPEPTFMGRLNLAMIAPYPFLMIGLAATGVVDRPLGRALVLADGLIVGAIAVAHARALHQPAVSPAPQTS